MCVRCVCVFIAVGVSIITPTYWRDAVLGGNIYNTRCDIYLKIERKSLLRLNKACHTLYIYMHQGGILCRHNVLNEIIQSTKEGWCSWFRQNSIIFCIASYLHTWHGCIICATIASYKVHALCFGIALLYIALLGTNKKPFLLLAMFILRLNTKWKI